MLSRKDVEGAWWDVSAEEFAAEVLAVAKGLMAEGLRAGDRVAIMARTTYEWTLLDFAAWAAGLVTVPIYPTSSAFQARWILQDSGAVACAVETKEQGRLISQERRQLGDLAHLWQFDTGAIGHLTWAAAAFASVRVHDLRDGARVLRCTPTGGTSNRRVATLPSMNRAATRD
ncbi:Long-chain-fatty-acid--CoA ligase FadD15 [Streptomyces microflavus]